MNQNQNTDNTAGAVAQERLVRPSITPEQRSEFRQWSAAIEMLSDADKESEAGAWIASALGILGKTNALLDAPVRLCCGQRHFGPVCPDGMVMCCLCFERVSQDKLNVASNGQKEDVCNECAERESASNDKDLARRALDSE
jgi:hypothetical protein